MTHTKENMEKFKAYFVEGCNAFGIDPGLVEVTTQIGYHSKDALAGLDWDDDRIIWIVYMAPQLRPEQFRFAAYHEAGHVAVFQYRNNISKVMHALIGAIEDLTNNNEELLVDGLAKALYRLPKVDNKRK